MEVTRPRVAGIGLADSQADSLQPLCGDLRRAPDLRSYLRLFSWTETDIVVSRAAIGPEIDVPVHLLAVGCRTTIDFGHEDFLERRVGANRPHTEREVTIHANCPQRYRELARELAEDLTQASRPPSVLSPSRALLGASAALIRTTSGHPVALRSDLRHTPRPQSRPLSRAIALVLPEVRNLAAWFREFLSDVHDVDQERVPTKPPRLVRPSDWYTLREAGIAADIAAASREIEDLQDKMVRLRMALDAAGAEADGGIRQALWGDGDELVEAVTVLLEGLGFDVEDLDATRSPNEPRREDLRLTHEDREGWEAIVEVKGYSRGIRTNDARQIREHRERYIVETGRPPDLTVWLANPFREVDPSSRPPVDVNVAAAAEQIGAVLVLASSLYLQWTLVKAGRLDEHAVVTSLTNAAPGSWDPLAPDSLVVGRRF